LTAGYRRLIEHALAHRAWILPAGALLAGSALIFVVGLDVPMPWGQLTVKPIGRELVPSEDQNRLLVNIICPVGSSIDYVDEMLQRSEELLRNMRDDQGREVAATYFSAISIRPGSLISEGILFVRLVPASERSMTQTDVINAVRTELSTVPGMRAVALDL